MATTAPGLESRSKALIVHVDPAALCAHSLTPPVSKSDALRALAAATLFGLPKPKLDVPRRAGADVPGRAHALPLPDHAAGPDREGAATPEDVLRFAAGLAQLESPRQPTIDCGDGGAPFRFLLALAAATPGAQVHFTGSSRLGERPHDPLVTALEKALAPFGCIIERGAPWPVAVRGITRVPEGPGAIHVAANQSSQFATAAHFAAARLTRSSGFDWTVRLEGDVASAGYLQLTHLWLDAARAGALPNVPTDWSSAAYLLLIAHRLRVPVHQLAWSAPHPDRAIITVLKQLGLTVEGDPTRVTGTPVGGIDFRVPDAPDLAPTLAALACVLPAPSILRRVSILRAKESDRVEGIHALVHAFGADCRLDGDALRISPIAHPPRHVAFDARGDHRFALCATTLAVLTGATLTLRGAECVKKSFPSFFTQLGVPTSADASPSTAR